MESHSSGRIVFETCTPVLKLFLNFQLSVMKVQISGASRIHLTIHKNYKFLNACSIFHRVILLASLGKKTLWVCTCISLIKILWRDKMLRWAAKINVSTKEKWRETEYWFSISVIWRSCISVCARQNRTLEPEQHFAGISCPLWRLSMKINLQ